MIPLLLPILATLVPKLVSMIAGDHDGEIAAKVVATVKAITGSDDPALVQSALSDPAIAGRLQADLLQLQNTLEIEHLHADLELAKSILADLSSARQQTVALAQAGSMIAWGAPVFSVIATLGFFGLLGTLMVIPAPSLSRDLINILLGTTSTVFTMVASYWVGSSIGSHSKDGVLGKLAQGGLAALPRSPFGS